MTDRYVHPELPAPEEKPDVPDPACTAVIIAIEALAQLYRYATEENYLSDDEAASDALEAIQALAKILADL